MANCCITTNSSQENSSVVSKTSIDTIFELPSPLPTWPQGDGFASGVIDLGGLLVSEVSNFTKIWATHEGGPDDVGATFYEPSSLKEGYFMLGGYSQPNNKPFSGWVLAGKDLSGGVLTQPIDYTLVWSSESLDIKQDGIGYIWLPIPPDGYRAVGHIVTTSPAKPSLDKIRCVRSDYTDTCENGDWIWSNGINVYGSRLQERGVRGLSVPSGTFIAQSDGNASSLACLKNVNANLSAMPNFNQIQALFNEYSPKIYFHPDEDYFPSSTTWFFENGALLYTKGQESNPVGVNSSGSNLPQGGSTDGAYWLDLPVDGAARDKVKTGDVQNAEAYLHVKPVLGATFTDLVVWIFYPFNGAAKAKIEFITLSLGKIGEHVGDWEHVTLRISNFDGALKNVYFAQHSKGVWMDASEIEYENGNKPVVYSSRHGHAAYAKPGMNLQGDGGSIGIRNDADKGNIFMDTGVKYSIISAQYLSPVITEPPWLNYAREWGPKISYDINNEISKITKFMPGKLKKAFRKFVGSLPNEVLGEEGPVGPKWKDSWEGDERT